MRGAGAASVGVAATGLVTYAYFSLASHALPADEYGRITLLWAAVFIVVSVLYRPVEQLLARTIARSDARGEVARRPLRDAARIQLALAAAFAIAALVLREPLQGGLLGGSATLYWILIGTVLAYGGSYFARGVLAGRRRLGAYGGLLLLESSTRIVFALAVAVGLAAGASFVALGIVVGPAVSLAVVAAVFARGLPRAPRPGEHGSTTPTQPAGEGAEPELTLRHGAGYAGGVLLIMACEQAFLNGGPVLVDATAGAGGAALAGFVFNALLIVRAPLQLFQAVQASILPHLARLDARGRADSFARDVTATLLAIAAFSALVALALLAVGPPVMELLFGGGFEYGRGGLALLGAAMGLYLAAATLTQAALARGRAGRAAARWALGAAVFVVLLVVPSFEDRVLQVELAFAVGALVLFAALYALHRSGNGREAALARPAGRVRVAPRATEAGQGGKRWRSEGRPSGS